MPKQKSDIKSATYLHNNYEVRIQDNVNSTQPVKNDSNIWGSRSLNYKIFYFYPKDLLIFSNKISFSIWAIYDNNSYWLSEILNRAR